ncbi:MAG: response regulator [Firmicutes bacterium]|nr:response regulator [Bacillota bacterium]
MKVRPTILIADDTEVNIDILVNTLQDDYELSVALDGETAIQITEDILPDLILLDIMMPGMNGYEVYGKLKESQTTSGIPVIFITALSDEENEAYGLKMGAVDYITKPFNPELVKARIRNHIELKGYRDDLEHMVSKKVRQLSQAKAAIIASMGILAEFRDPETGAHIHRTQNYVKILAEGLAPKKTDLFKPEDIELLYQSVPLHDIGKIGIPDYILLKPGKLTHDEFEEIKKHTIYGSQAIQRTEKYLGTNTFLYLAREVAEFHHEKWDGTGYPHGLKGNEIPLSARIMAVADVYDALTSRRPYKDAIPHSETLRIITEGDGRTMPGHFDPDLLSVFLETAPEFEKISIQFQD